MERNTNDLTETLKQAAGSGVDAWFTDNREEMLDGERPFAVYMRSLIDAKGVSRQNMFLESDISEGYGYKLLSEEKRTRRRDVILCLCIAAHFTLEELQRALRLYGMSPLYPRLHRDALIIAALSVPAPTVDSVNSFLEAHGEAGIRTWPAEES